MHTADIYNKKHSKKKLGTIEFADAVIERLGKHPEQFKTVEYQEESDSSNKQNFSYKINNEEKKTLVGVDVTIDWRDGNPSLLADKINEIVSGSEVGLQIISVKGLKVWPEASGAIINTDEYNLRFVPTNTEKVITHGNIVKLLQNLNSANIDFVRINNLYLFDDKLGFSLAQGE